ncbi:metallophosphoesterase family protein [Pseudomonas aeruginosa]
MRVLSIDGARYSRIFVVGDLFGNFSPIHNLLDIVDFNCSKDLLVLAGNFLGMTLNSGEAPHWLERPWIKAVMGDGELAVLSKLQDLDVASLIGQWLSLLPQVDREKLQSSLERLPMCLEFSIDGKIVPVSSRPLKGGARWSQFKANLLAREGHPMCMTRGFEGRNVGLAAAKLIKAPRVPDNPDVLFSLSTLQLEQPRSAVAFVGNRAVMLGSAHLNHGPIYDRPCLLPYVELKSLVNSYPGVSKCLMGMINSSTGATLNTNSCTSTR